MSDDGYINREMLAERDAAVEMLDAALTHIKTLEAALEVYADCCDATETTPCGYEGNMCCKTARDALNKARNK